MFKLPSRSVFRLLVVFVFVFSTLGGGYSQAQDTPTDTPTDPPTVIPTDVPTDVPTESPTDVPTEAPTDAPTDVPTAVVTEAPPTEATDVPTSETPIASPEASPTEVTSTPALPAEPPMTYLINDSFDSGTTGDWVATPGWSLVPSESGSAWQVTNSNTPLTLAYGDFFNVAVQARFLLQSGSAQLIVRQSVSGNYTASMDAAGLVGLYRAGVLLQSVQLTPVASGAWRTLRLSAADGILRVAVDGVEVIALTDANQLPTGAVAFAGDFAIPTDGSAAPQNTFLVDDFVLSVKTNEIQLYLTPTPAPTEVATQEVPTEVPATETPVATTPEPSPEAPATAAPTPGAEPSMSALVSDSFDSGDPSAWTAANGWSLVPSENGFAWQVTNSNAPLVLANSNYFNVAVQARFSIQGGAAALIVRQSDAGNYTVTLDDSGFVSLYRAGTLLQQTVVTPAQAGGWQTLRLSAVDGVLRVAVDGVEVITLADAAQLPPGSVAMAGSFIIPTDGSDASQNTLLADDFVLSVKTDELSQYPVPTATEAAPAEVTETATPPAPTAVVTETPAAVPTFVGKDTSAFPKPSAAQIQAVGPTDNNNFTNAIDVNPSSSNPLYPYLLSNGDTTGADLETNEVIPSCGIGIANTVWFKFTPLANATFSFTTAGSSFDTIMAVYKDPTSGSAGADNLTTYACNDDVNTSTFTSALSLALTKNVTYYIQISGYNGRYGAYQFKLSQVGVPAPASAPMLTGPADNFRTNNGSVPLPDLTWNPVLTNADHYQIQIDDNSLFNSVNQGDSNLTATSYTVSPDLPGTAGTTYYWRVRAFNVNNVPGPFSAVRKFVVDTLPPPAPNLTAPAVNAIVSAPKPKFTWAAVTGANGYYLDVDDTDCTFPSPEISQQLVVGTTFTPATSLPQGTYCWRLQAKDAAGNIGATSTPRSFSIFIGTIPANGLFSASATPKFTWATVPGATSYTLHVSTDSTFSSADAFSCAQTTVLNCTATTLASGTYYWRVITDLDTPASVGFRTLFIGTLPAAPILTMPVGGSLQTTPTVDLGWNVVSSGTITLVDYQVQVAKNSLFSVGLQTFTSATNSFTTPSLLDGTYYWRVRARFGDASAPITGGFSASRSFIVDTHPPAAPVLSAPANNALVANERPTFKWAVAATATKYQLDVDDDPEGDGTCDFASPIINSQLVTGVSYTIPAISSPLAQGSYCWQVRSVDAANNVSGNSTPRHFTVFIGTAPANGAFAASPTPKFTWMAVGGATGYNVEIATDTAFTLPVSGYPQPVGTVTTFTPGAALDPGTYYWRITPIGETPVSSVFRTLFIGTAPAVPVLTSPASGARFATTTVDLSWNAVVPSSGISVLDYQVQIAKNSLFTVGLQTLTTTTIPFTTPTLADGTYYWKVRARFGDASAPVLGGFSLVRNFIVDTLPPPAPSLTAPANNALVANERPTFKWAAAATATKYQLDVDDDPEGDGTCDFASPVINSQLVTGVTYTIPAGSTPLAQGAYCWRVRSVDAANNVSGNSAPRSVTVFIGTAPAAGVFNATGKPVFTWMKVVGATGYNVEIATDTGFLSPIGGYPVSVSSTLAMYTPSIAIPGGTYYWRITPTGETPVSSVFRTLFVGTVPAVPVLTSPASGARFATPTVDLTWNPVVPSNGISVLDYQVQIAKNSLFTVGLQTLTTTSIPFTTPSLADGTYYWKVRARFGNAAAPVIGGFSLVRNFIVDVTPPAVPVLLTPGNNASITVNPPTFTWAAVAGATKYNLLYGTTSTPSIPVNNIVGTSYKVPSPLPLNTYYWQVQAVDAAGNMSAFSAVRSFKIISVVNAVPLLNRFAASPIVLTWGPISWVTDSNAGAGAHYEIVVDNNISFPSAQSAEFSDLNVDPANHSISIPISGSLVTGTYYWRVRACQDTAANTCGAWSSTGTFTIDQ